MLAYLQIPRQRINHLIRANVMVDENVLPMREGIQGLP